MRKAKKVGTLVKPATTILPNYIKSKRKKPTQLGPNGEEIIVEKDGPRQGLDVHYSIKVWRVTQVPEEYNGKEVHILYGNGRDKKKEEGKRQISPTTHIDGRIGLWEKTAEPYEVDVTLEPIEVEDKDEIPWEIHPAVFSLRTPHHITAEEEVEIEEKRVKKHEKAEKKRLKAEKKGKSASGKDDKKKKKKKKKGEEEDEEEDDDDEEDDDNENEDEFGEYVLEEKYIWDVVGSRVQMDLAEYMEHGSNITEAYGVPTARPKKKKRTKTQKKEDKKAKKEDKKAKKKEEKEKKKRRKAGEESDDEEEEEEEEEEWVPTMCYKLVVTVQATWLRYFGRRITNEPDAVGEKVVIDGQEWTYLEDAPEEDENGESVQPKRALPATAAAVDADEEEMEEEAGGKSKLSILKKAKAKTAALKESRKEKKEDAMSQKEYLKQQKELAKRAEAEAKEERALEARLEKERQQAELERQREEEEIDRLAQEDFADDMDLAKKLEKERLRRAKEDKKKKKPGVPEAKLKKAKSKSSKANLLEKAESSSSKSHKRSSSKASSKTSAEVLAAKEHVRKASSGSVETVDASPARSRREVTLNRSIVKKKTRVDFVITVKEVVCSERHNGQMVFFAWKRGMKKENSGESARALCEDSRAEFPDSSSSKMKLSCTFVQAQRKNEYEEKNVAISVKSEKAKKSSLVGKALLNLADYAEDGLARDISISLVGASKGESASILARIEATQTDDAKSTPNVKSRLSAIPVAASGSKKRVKVRYEITMEKVEGISCSSGTHVMVKWARGTKPKNNGITDPAVCEKKVVQWPLGTKPVVLECSMMQGKAGFSAKKLSLTVIKVSKGKEKVVGKCAVDLADMVDHGFASQCRWTIKSKSGGAGILAAFVRTTWETFDGKKVSDAPTDGTQSESMAASGGKEIFLEEVAADEQSEIDDATQLSDDILTETEGGSDDEFEDDADLPAAQRGAIAFVDSDDDEDKYEPQASMMRSPPVVAGGSSLSPPSKSVGFSDQESRSPRQDAASAPVAAVTPAKFVPSYGSDSDSDGEGGAAAAREPAASAAASPAASSAAAPSAALEARVRQLEEENARLAAAASSRGSPADGGGGDGKAAKLAEMNQKLLGAVEVMKTQLENAKAALEGGKRRETDLSEQLEREKGQKAQAVAMVAQFEEQLESLKQAASGKSKSKGKSKVDVEQLTQIHEQEKRMVQGQLQQAQKELTDASDAAKKAQTALQRSQAEVEKLKQEVQQAERHGKAAAEEASRAAVAAAAVAAPAAPPGQEFVVDVLYGEPVVDERHGGFEAGHSAAIFAAQNWQAAALATVLQGIETGAKLAGGDMEKLSYWTSVTCTMLRDLQEHPSLGFSGDLRSEGVRQRESDLAPPAGSKLTAGTGEAAINGTLCSVFELLLHRTYKRLDQTLRHSFIEGSMAILDGGAPQQGDPSKSIYRVTDTLEELLAALVDAEVPDVVVRQAFEKVLYYISASLFNAIVTTRSLCSAKTGFRVKMGLSFLECWVTDQNSKFGKILGNAGRQLEYCKQGANVLCMATNESVFSSVDSVRDMFEPLSLNQVRKLLTFFSPDSFAPEPVPDSVKRLMTNAPSEGDSITLPEELQLEDHGEEADYGEEEAYGKEEGDYEEEAEYEEEQPQGRRQLNFGSDDDSEEEEEGSGEYSEDEPYGEEEEEEEEEERAGTGASNRFDDSDDSDSEEAAGGSYGFSFSSNY